MRINYYGKRDHTEDGLQYGCLCQCQGTEDARNNSTCQQYSLDEISTWTDLRRSKYACSYNSVVAPGIVNNHGNKMLVNG